MPRIFISSPDVNAGIITLTEKEKVHYLRDVLRLRKEEELTVVDEKKTVYHAAVEKIKAHSIILKVKRVDLIPDRLSRPKLTIACAIPKRTRMDDIIDKLTQLGVDCIIPMLTKRVIVKLDTQAAGARLARWQKVAQSASEQSQRDTLPVVEGIRKFEEVIEGSGGYDLKLIPALIGERKALRKILDSGEFKDILVLIGPEGDFTPQELALAISHGFIPVTMGEQVLRVETAACAVVAFLRLYELG